MKPKDPDMLDIGVVTGFLCPYCGAFSRDMQAVSDCRQRCHDAKQSAAAKEGDEIELMREKHDVVYVVDKVKIVNNGGSVRMVNFIVHRQGAGERIVVPAHVVKKKSAL